MIVILTSLSKNSIIHFIGFGFFWLIDFSPHHRSCFPSSLTYYFSSLNAWKFQLDARYCEFHIVQARCLYSFKKS